MIIWADQKATELDFALSKMTHRAHEMLVDLERSRAADADETQVDVTKFPFAKVVKVNNVEMGTTTATGWVWKPQSKEGYNAAKLEEIRQYIGSL